MVMIHVAACADLIWCEENLVKNTRIDWGNIVVPNIQYGITYKYITIFCTGYLPMIGTEIFNPIDIPTPAVQWPTNGIAISLLKSHESKLKTIF